MDGSLQHCTGGSDQDHSQEKKCKNTKWLSEEALQIAVKRRQVKSKGVKERYKHLNAEFQRITRRDKKAFLSDQCKEIEENNRMNSMNDFSSQEYIYVVGVCTSHVLCVCVCVCFRP